MAQEKKERVKPRPVTTRERLKAKFEKVSGWISQVDNDVSETNHRDIVSGVDGGVFLINQTLANLKPVLDEEKMTHLKERLRWAGVSNTLPKADPRLMEIKAPEPITTIENPLSDEVVIGQIRQKMLASFRQELNALREVLPQVKAKALAEVKNLVQERRELAGIRKGLRNRLRDPSKRAKAAFERLAKGGQNPKWVWSGNVAK